MGWSGNVREWGLWVILLFVVSFLSGSTCRERSGEGPDSSLEQIERAVRSEHEAEDGSDGPTITREAAIEIAQLDARKAYDDLSKCDPQARFDGTNWHVDFVFQADQKGGCPKYLVSGDDGEILEKAYHQ